MIMIGLGSRNFFSRMVYSKKGWAIIFWTSCVCFCFISIRSLQQTLQPCVNLVTTKERTWTKFDLLCKIELLEKFSKSFSGAYLVQPMNTRDRFFHNSTHVFGNGRKFGDKNVSCISTVIQKQVRLPIVTAYIQEMLHYFHALKAQQFCRIPTFFLNLQLKWSELQQKVDDEECSKKRPLSGSFRNHQRKKRTAVSTICFVKLCSLLINNDLSSH